MWPAGQAQGRKPQAGIPQPAQPAKPPFVPQQPTPPQHPHPHAPQLKAGSHPGGYQQVRYNQNAGYPQGQMQNTASQNNPTTVMSYPHVVDDDDDDDIIEAADPESPETLAMAREFGKQDRANIKAKREKLKALAAPVPVPLSPEDLAEMLSRIQGEESRAVASQVSRLYQEALGHLTRNASIPTRRNSAIRFDAAQRPKSTLGIILGQGPESTCSIHDIVPGSPAFNNSKLRRGDTILKVDEEVVNRDNLVQCMRGSDIPGTMVSLEISRPGRKRPFEVHLSRAANDVVSKKRALHEQIVQLGAVASSASDKNEREAAATSVVNEIVHMLKQIDHESLESEAILMGDVVDKQNAIRMLQGDLVEFVKSFASRKTEAGADSQRAWKQGGGGGPADARSLEAVHEALVRIDAAHKAQCESLLSDTQPRLEFLDGAISRVYSAMGTVASNMPAGGPGKLPVVDRLQRSLAEASARIQELSREAEQARTMRVAVERQLKEVEQRNSFAQLSLTAATADYRRTKAELRLLQEEVNRAAKGDGGADLQAQLELHKKLLKQGEDERERERESMHKTVAEAAERQTASEMDAAQLREDLRNIQAALDDAKKREWELELSVHTLSTKEATPQEMLDSVSVSGTEPLSMAELVTINAQLAPYNLRLAHMAEGDTASLETEVQRALESLSKATEQLRDKEAQLEATTSMLGEERRKVLTTRGENSWLTKQLGARMYGASEGSGDLLVHFETRLAELEDLTAAEALQLEGLVAKLTRGMYALEAALRDSREMAAGLKAKSDANRELLRDAQKEWYFQKEVLEVELARVQEKVSEIGQRSLKMTADNNGLRATLAEREMELRSVVSEKESETRARQREAEEARVTQEELRAQQDQLQKTVVNLTTEKESLARERDAMGVQIGQLQTSVAMLEEKAKEWNVREASLVKLLEDVEQKSERMVSIVEETEKEKSAAQNRLDQAERKLLSQDGTQKEMIERLRKEIAALEKDKEEATKKRETTNDRMQEVKRENHELSKEVLQIGERLREAETEREMLETKVSHLCLQMEERVSRLEQSEDPDGDGAETVSTDERTRMLQEQLRDREERLRKAQEESSTLGQGLKAARKQLEMLEREKAAAAKQAEDVAIEMEEAVRKKEEVEKSVVEIMSERELALAETAKFRAALAEAERERKEMFNNGDELSRLLAEAETRTRETKVRLEVEVAKVRQLETERGELRTKAKQLTSSLKAAEEEKDRVAKQLAGTSETAAELQKCKIELERSKQSIDSLGVKLESVEVANRTLQSKLSMVAVRVRQQELEISLAISDASDSSKDLERDFKYMEAKVSALQMAPRPSTVNDGARKELEDLKHDHELLQLQLRQAKMRDGQMAQQAELIKVLQGDKDRLREQHMENAAELAKARQRADVAIEELARLRKDSFTHQESTEEIAALRQRNARLETELKESVGMQLQQLQERLMVTDRGLREEGEVDEDVLEKLRGAEERNRELQAKLQSEKELVRELQALKKDTSDERQVLIGELQAAAEDVRAANLRAAGAQARMEEMQYEIEGRKTVKPAADASTSPVTGSPTKAENVAKMREHVQGLEKELRAERSSYEANMQKLLGERDQLATLLKSQAPGSQPANPEPQPVAANTVKREGDIGTFFQSFFAPRSQPEPPRPALSANPKAPQASVGSPLTPGSAKARPLPPYPPGYTPPGASVPNTPSSSDPAAKPRDQLAGDSVTTRGQAPSPEQEAGTRTTSTPSPTRTIIM